MKRTLLSLITVLIATIAMAQTTKSEAWQSKYDEISKRANDIAEKYAEKAKAGDNEAAEALLKSMYAEIDNMIGVAKEVAADGSDPELAKKYIAELGEPPLMRTCRCSCRRMHRGMTHPSWRPYARK